MPGILQQIRELRILKEPMNFLDYDLICESTKIDRDTILRGTKELSKLLEHFKLDTNNVRLKRSFIMETE